RNLKTTTTFLRRVASKDLERLFALLPTFEHQKGIRLSDDVAKDPATAGPILQELLAVVSNHDDPQLHTPHGVLTIHAGRELLRLTRPPGGLGLLRFLIFYNFSLPKRPLTASQVEAAARAIPSASDEDQQLAYRKFVFERMGAKAAPLHRTAGRRTQAHWPRSSRNGSSIASSRSCKRSPTRGGPMKRTGPCSSRRARSRASSATR